jgi:hypothetical protein
MKDVFECTGRLVINKKLESSVNGNPRYLVSIGLDRYRYEAKTTVDSGIAYEITNYDLKMVKVKLGFHYNQLSIVNIEELLADEEICDGI